MWCVSVGVGVWLCMSVYVRATIARHLVGADARRSGATFGRGVARIRVPMGTRARVKRKGKALTAS